LPRSKNLLGTFFYVSGVGTSIQRHNESRSPSMKRTVPYLGNSSNGDVTNHHDPNGNVDDEERRKRLRAQSAVTADVRRLIVANSNDDSNIGFDERREGYRFLQQLQQQQDQQRAVAAAMTAATTTRQDNLLFQNISATISSALSGDVSSNELLRSRASSVAQAFHQDSRRGAASLGDGALALYSQQQIDHAALKELMHRYGSTGGGVSGENRLDSTNQQQPMLPPDPNRHNLSYSSSRSITGTKVISTLHGNKCLCK
jgi:hypothetical protein